MDLSSTVTRQYQAPLTMLGKAIELCPADLWLQGSPNRFWHIAYHALFYTQFYLSETDKDFVPWSGHRAEYNFLGAVPWRPANPNARPIQHIPYTQPELLDYHAVVVDAVNHQVPRLDLDAPSGFHWLPFNKLELQLYSIRHAQHHTGQLADRLRTFANIGLGWVR
jgi:hypothetical protein